jgi:hypothetical protein
MIDSIFDEVDKKKCLLKLIASNAIKICFSIFANKTTWNSNAILLKKFCMILLQYSGCVKYNNQ